MKKEFNITIFSENSIGLLNRITINFTRRKINIESLTVSASAYQGISKFIIVVNDTEERVQRVVAQLDKLVDVLKAYYNTNESLIYQEIALYKVPSEYLLNGNNVVETLVRESGARILEINNQYAVIEKTGHTDETQALFAKLSKDFNCTQFVRSGRIAITRSPVEKLSVFLKERDAMLSQIED
ncbi:MAG: acetolactate synthase small subunit [Bacteroidales bacterium]|nr:acetolactate synthase small subunit [Bacteroidales bacterium]